MNDINYKDIYTVTKLEISLANIEHNFLFFKSLMPKKTKIMAMIKAAAYGNGAVGLAQFIQNKQLAAYLGVAYVQEGVALRNAGLTLPILVLNPEEHNFSVMIQHCLEPQIHNLRHLKSFDKALMKEGFQRTDFSIHLKFNTGMNRLGFDSEDLSHLIEYLKAHTGFKVQSIMTHLSASGMPKEKSYTLAQFQQFDDIWDQIKKYLPVDCWRHALNSNGIYYFPNHHYDMVRLGIGMYGASSVPVLKNNLKEISALKTHITQSRTLKKGSTIGYSRAGKLHTGSNIATLAIGYEDGVSRALGNGKWMVEIEGKLYPTIGNICMDMCMINLGSDSYDEGKEVLIFGGKKSIHDYAAALNTITYEAMCRIGNRVERVLI